MLELRFKGIDDVEFTKYAKEGTFAIRRGYVKYCNLSTGWYEEYPETMLIEKIDRPNETICAECGAIINYEECREVGSLHLCGSCFDTAVDSSDIIQCHDCRDWIFSDDSTYIDGEDYSVCESCRDNNYSYCDHCETYHRDDCTSTVYTESGSEVWCDDCVSDHAFWCERQEIYASDDIVEEIHMDNGTTNMCTTEYARNHFYQCSYCDEWYESCRNLNIDSNNEWICERCSERVNERIRRNHDSDMNNMPNRVEVPLSEESVRINSYHDNHGRERYFGAVEGGKFKGLGIELEVCRKYGDTNQVLRGLKTILGDHVTYENDGSIGDGFEMISQPHTIDEFYKVDWALALDYLRTNGFISHDSEKCGLHVHLSRTLFGDTREKQDENIGKMILFYEKWYDNIVKISRRTNEQLRWARRYYSDYSIVDYLDRFEVAEETKENVLKDMCKNWKKASVDRYKCVNTNNSNTIEIRIMRGTLRKETFFATIDFIWNIALNSLTIEDKELTKWDAWLKNMKPETLDYINSKLA